MKDIFEAKRITKIRRHLKDDYISCTVYTEWEGYDENGKRETLTKLKQFCYARGLLPNWIKDNPYLKKEVIT